jgi:hypothetical protein
MKITDLIPNAENPRVIKKERLEKLKKSIDEFPKMFRYRPIVVDSNNMVLGGNMRLNALIALGFEHIPDNWVVKADDLTEDEIRRFIIVDNIGFGEDDFEMLYNEWDIDELKEWGFEDKSWKESKEVSDDFNIDDNFTYTIQFNSSRELEQFKEWIDTIIDSYQEYTTLSEKLIAYINEKAH